MKSNPSFECTLEDSEVKLPLSKHNPSQTSFNWTRITQSPVKECWLEEQIVLLRWFSCC